MPEDLLEVKGLETKFKNLNNELTVIEDVSFTLKKGEILAVVGESGSGKSVTSLSIMRLINPPGRISDGEVIYNGENLLSLKEREMQKIRGKEISMIFQEPMTSLNPILTIGEQISEGIRKHQKLPKKKIKNKVIELLKLVGIPNPEGRFNEYPHQLSGGMRQRIMIAIALSNEPKVLIADEPTTALDVTIQAQILELIKNIKEQKDMSVIIITHDLGVVAEVADRVVVMYSGQVVEESNITSLFDKPMHPYTEGLIYSSLFTNNKGEKLNTIQGSVPQPGNIPKGCRFHPRCQFATEKCFEIEPELEIMNNNRKVRCWNPRGD